MSFTLFGARRRRARMLGASLCAAAMAGLLSGSLVTPTAAARVHIDFETVTISRLDHLLADGEITSQKLAADYVKRIKQVNTDGPGLRAVQSIDPTWRAQAKAADRRRRAGHSRGPLDGIPVIVKDNIDVKGMPTTAGSLALADNVAGRDATLTTNLRRAGAVIIAKATLVEFAFWDGKGSWGYSSLGGQPLNPYDASYTTSGSSAGPGIAAAAGLAAITFGTDTGGSVVTPAEKMSLVGYRPTTGLISRTGIVPITTFSDTPGVMGRTVRDVAVGATAVAGVDPSDPATTASTPYQGADYARILSKASLHGKRIGVVSPSGLTDDQKPLWNAAAAALSQQGATVVPVEVKATNFPFTATTYEFRRNLDQYLQDRTPARFPIKNVHQLADFYRADPEDTQKYGASTLFNAEKVDLGADKKAHDDDLQTAQTDVRATIEGLIAADHLDAFLFAEPSTVQFEAAIGSYPEVAVPAGYQASDRHPFGIVFMGKKWDDAALLSYAYDYEQATKLRQTPSAINPTMWRCVGRHPSSRSRICLP